MCVPIRQLFAHQITARNPKVDAASSQFTGDFTQNGDLGFPVHTLESRLLQSTRKGSLHLLPASQLALAALGDTLAANLMITGYAWQSGMLPISREAIHGAIELNGIAIDWNKQAFEWGRALAHQIDLQDVLLKPATEVVKLVDTTLPRDVVDRFAQELERYHNLAYADRYRQWLATANEQVIDRVGPQQALLNTVARSLYKLMAYKDEYEVARLHSDPEFLASIAARFEGNYKLSYHLAPPLISRVDKATGRPQKIRFGGWMRWAFKLLAKLKVLRHTPLDIFGYSAERRLERRLIEDYKTLITGLIGDLTPERLAALQTIAALPMILRGYGHVKIASLERYETELQSLLEQWHAASNQEVA